MQADHGPRGGGRAVMAKRAGKRSGKAKAVVIAQRNRKEQLRSGKAVRAGVTRHGSDAQHKTGGEVAGPGGPGGIGLVRPWMRAGVFYQ
jgi:hypothetical protein